jgi:hypothetical protein
MVYLCGAGRLLRPRVWCGGYIPIRDMGRGWRLAAAACDVREPHRQRGERDARAHGERLCAHDRPQLTPLVREDERAQERERPACRRRRQQGQVLIWHHGAIIRPSREIR